MKLKTKTSDLTGPALDWAVALAAGYKPRVYSTQSIRAELPTGGVIAPFMPGFRWSQGGPIIEREGIRLHRSHTSAWWAGSEAEPQRPIEGPTPLIAAMRCFVASKLGDTIDIPEELV